MAGKLILLLGACALAAVELPLACGKDPADCGAETPSSPLPKRPDGDAGSDGKRRSKGDSADREKFNNVRKAIEALTPEQKKRFEENFQRWSNLTPEEKKALADRDTFRRKKIAEDIDAALKEAGLTLNAEHRELFGKRYGEERHRIEEQLRKEFDEKRQPLLKEVIAKLKLEFGTNDPAPSAQPAEASAKPSDPASRPNLPVIPKP